MGGFSRSLLRQIREVFPASDVSVNNPADVSDDVQFVANYLPPTLRLDQMQNEAVVLGGGTLIVDTSVVPANRYRYILSSQVFHSDAVTPHQLSILIRNDNLGIAAMITSSVFLAAGAAVAGNVLMPAHRPFLVPSGWRVRGAVDVLGGGNLLNIEITFLELPVMETTPPI